MQIDILYISMFYMQLPLFGGTLGLTGADPVGGFVAGAFKLIFFNESFSPRRRLVLPLRAGGQQVQGVIVGFKPVIADSSNI